MVEGVFETQLACKINKRDDRQENGVLFLKYGKQPGC